MKTPLLSAKWIRIGFCAGLGMGVAFVIVYAAFAVCLYVLFAVLSLLRTSAGVAFPFIVYGLIGLLLLTGIVFIPAFAGKRLGTMVAKKRESQQLAETELGNQSDLQNS